MDYFFNPKLGVQDSGRRIILVVSPDLTFGNACVYKHIKGSSE